MDKASQKVFAQAEELWTPEAGVMRQAFDLRREGIDRKAGANGQFGSGNRIRDQANAAAAEVEARGAKVLECLLEAHKVAKNIRSKDCSADAFSAWYGARMDEEAAQIRRNPPLVSGHRETVQHYVDAVAEAIKLAKDRARAQIRQHFETDTESRLWHYTKMIAQLKSVHPAW
jgi:hypothetical protein